MEKQAWAILFVIFCFKNGFAASETAVQEVPFELHDHLIVVTGSIGPLDGLSMVIDTGTSSTMISSQIARKLRLEGETKHVVAYATRVKARSVTIPKLTIGPLKTGNVQGWVAELNFPGLRRRLRIDALIGLDILRRAAVTIDYESKSLRFGPFTHSENPVAFYAGLPILTLHLFIQGHRFRVLLDTGAPDLIFWEAKTAGRITAKRTGEKKEIRSLGGRAILKKVRMREVALGGTHWGEVTAFLLQGPLPPTGVDGVLGPLSLGFRRLYLDFPAGLLSWER